MPRDKAAIVRRAFDSFNRRDLAAAIAAFDPDGEWIPYLAALEEHVYRGRERIAAMWRDVLTGFPDFRLELLDVVDDREDAIVVEVEFQGVGKASGADTRTTVFQVISFHHGKVMRVEGFRDRAEALEALAQLG
jgi:ketosteroid isomerase-like protein